MTPTEEQEAIRARVRSAPGNIMMQAYAGTGKSETLRMLNEIFAKEPALYLVFGHDAAKEAKAKFPSSTEIRTFNGMGNKIALQTYSCGAPDGAKMSKLLSEVIKGLPWGDDRKEIGDLYWDIVDACSRAKNLGYIPNGKFSPARSFLTAEQFYAQVPFTPTPLSRKCIDALLVESIKIAYKGGFDWDDQIYMPTLFGGSFPRFPRVMVDEVQDLNPVNIAMLEKLGKGWVGAVGDQWQSIYAFRGAVRNGVNEIKTKFKMEEFPLSISFRCPQAVVEAARWRVPAFRWIKPGGVYERLERLATNDIPDGAAILCRNNAPLYRLAFGLIKAGRSIKVAGSDIGPRIVRLLKKIGKNDEGIAQNEMLGRIAEWEIKQLDGTRNEKTIQDTAECLRIFVNLGTRLGHAIVFAERLFKQEGTIQLLTGHKAKGKEWDTVFHLDPWLLSQEEQDLNLRYVIQTRAKESAYEIDTRGIECLHQAIN